MQVEIMNSPIYLNKVMHICGLLGMEVNSPIVTYGYSCSAIKFLTNYFFSLHIFKEHICHINCKTRSPCLFPPVKEISAIYLGGSVFCTCQSVCTISFFLTCVTIYLWNTNECTNVAFWSRLNTSKSYF